jgi:thiamine transport system permease protein
MMLKKIKAGYLGYPAFFLLWFVPIFFFARDFFTLSSFSGFITDRYLLRIAGFTAFQALLSMLVSFIIAIPAALYARRGNLLSSLIESTLFIPFFFPAVSCVVAFSVLFSSNGVFARLGFNPGILYTLAGVVIAHAFYNAPIFVKYIADALRSIPSDLVDDARISGAGSAAIFFKIEMPLILPSIARASFLVFTFCFMSFAVILGIGGVQFSTIEVEIATVLRGSLNFSHALSLGLIQCLLIAILSYISTLVRSFELPVAARPVRTSRIVMFCALAYLGFELLIAGSSVIASLFNPYTGHVDFSAFSHLADGSFNGRFPVVRSLINTLLLAGAGSVFSVAISFVLVRARRAAASSFVLSMMGVSSAFLATALVYFGIISDMPLPVLSCAGFVCISVPLCYSFLSQSLSRFDSRYVEEAKVMGAGSFRLLLHVELPLMAPAFAAAFLQSFAILFGEFTLAYTMQMQDSFPLLSVTIFSMESMRMTRESAALSTISILLVFLIYLVSQRIVMRRRYLWER